MSSLEYNWVIGPNKAPQPTPTLRCGAGSDELERSVP